MKHAAISRIALASTFTLGLAVSVNAQVSTLFGGGVAGTGEGNLHVLDQADYSLTELADTGYTRLSGLAVTPDGRMWGSTHLPSNDLLELDPETGNVLSTVKLEIDGDSPWVSDLAVQPGTGTIFALGRVNFEKIAVLYTVDPATGIMTEIGETGESRQGGLAFAADGTLYMSAVSFSAPLHTLNPATAEILSTVTIGALTGIHGLAFDPLTDELFGSNPGGKLFSIDPTTGASTLAGDLNRVMSGITFRLTSAKEEVRNSALGAPNQAQLLPGASSGPVIGSVWDPRIVASPGTTSLIDVMITAFGPADLPLLPGPNGVVLCNILTGPGIVDTNFSTPVGGVQQPFAIPFPDETSLLGITLCTQGGYADGTTPGLIHLTNAIDITIGAF
ncbi:MAG: hypothetical protein AAF682_17265 [Planctomycetota bacterium]